MWSFILYWYMFTIQFLCSLSISWRVQKKVEGSEGPVQEGEEEGEGQEEKWGGWRRGPSMAVQHRHGVFIPLYGGVSIHLQPVYQWGWGERGEQGRWGRGRDRRVWKPFITFNSSTGYVLLISIKKILAKNNIREIGATTFCFSDNFDFRNPQLHSALKMCC